MLAHALVGQTTQRGCIMFDLFTKYFSYIKWGGIASVWLFTLWAVHHYDNLALEAAKAEKTQVIVESLPQVVEKTLTITKVIRNANDKCSSTAIPPAIADQLR